MSKGGLVESAASQWQELRFLSWLAVCISSATLPGCDADQARTSRDAATAAEDAGPLRAVARSSRGPDGRPLFCQREVESSDLVRERFCADAPPTITSLSELQYELKTDQLQQLPADFPLFALLLGHSTSLSGRHVSSINPRAIVVAIGGGPLMTFTRGVQQVEITAMSLDQKTRRFYLLSFTQACNTQPEGCSPTDLYTSRVEQDWLSVELEDDEELKNTALDCRQCHQRARSTATLLMRELVPPWTHFFEPVSQEPGLRLLPGVLNTALARDYLAAHGDELYAGVDPERLSPANGSLLQAAVGTNQPVIFSSQEILNERWPRTPDGEYPAEPQASELWENAYAAFKRGEQLALPYVEQRATDPDKLAALSAAYTAFREGTREELPDLSDVFPDDPMVRARIGLQTEPDATPVETLIQACGACHNDVLDQTLTRARFNIDLSRMDGTELALAVERMLRSSGTPGVMPPPEARQLDSAAKKRLIDYLRTDARGAGRVDALVHAAKLGMTGGNLLASPSSIGE
jgi:hypothetical protein